jgi:hypothetical protein
MLLCNKVWRANTYTEYFIIFIHFFRIVFMC